MFAGIAGRYDIANRVLSLGIDRGWRRRLIQKVSDLNPRNVVDLATGSGDVALEMRQALAPSTEIRGMDFFIIRAFVESIKNNQKPVIDVYDAVSMSCIVPLSEMSIKLNSSSIKIPDFTRGRWKTNKPIFGLNDSY